MKVKKSNGKIFGANLTAAEKKAMDIEIRRSIDDYNRQNMNEIDAMVLWHLHEEFGFGKKRLMRFYESFSKRLKELSEQYLTEETRMPWMYQYRLKNYGIDIKELNQILVITKKVLHVVYVMSLFIGLYL